MLPGRSVQKSKDTIEASSKISGHEERSPQIPRIENGGDDEGHDFNIGEEASIATDVTGAYLKLPKGTTELGQAYSVRSPNALTSDQWQKYRMVLPSMQNQEPNLVVLYRIQKAGVDSYGLIPKTQLTFETGGVSVRLAGPGIYQVARTSVLIDSALDVPVTESRPWTFTTSLKLTSQGRPYDLNLLNGDLFIASDLQLEYFKSGATVSKKLATSTSLRRVAAANDRVYAAAQLRGLGFFTGFGAANDEYQGSYMTATTSSGGAFELAATPSKDSPIVLLQASTTAADVAQLGFFSVAVENPALLGNYTIRKAGNQTLSPSTSNLSTTLGAFLVNDSRIYAILTDGLHSLARNGTSGITNDTVVDGLDLPFCLAPGALESIVFVCHKGSRVAALQTADNLKPVILGEIDSSETLLAAAVDRNILFALAKSGRLYAYDVADPTKIIRRGDPLDLGLADGAPVVMKAWSGRLYIGYENNTIMVHTY